MKNKFFLLSILIIISLLIYFLLSQIISSVNQIWHRNSNSKELVAIPSWSLVIKSSQPAIVEILTESVVEQPVYDIPGLPAPFRYYMGPPETQRGQGSGFIINEDGYILTNQHVVAGAHKIRIKVGFDMEEYTAKIIGEDEDIDIALLQIEPKDKKTKKWPYLLLGDSDTLDLGDAVVNVSSPSGLTQSVIAGILSHKNRGGLKPSGRSLIPELFQFQMGIGPGSSGSPIMNTKGEVIAISESVVSGYTIAFAVPINIAKKAIPDLLSYGMIEKSFLGVNTLDLTSNQAKILGISNYVGGAIIQQVVKDTPAAKAGLQPMDVILEIDGYPIKDSHSLRQKTALAGVSKKVEITIFRKDKGKFKITATLEKRPGQRVKVAQNTPSNNSTSYTVEKLGISFKNAQSKGAIVTSVKRGSIAQRYDFMPNDIILSVNGKDIKSAKELKDIFEKASSNETLLILRMRDNDIIYSPLTIT